MFIEGQTVVIALINCGTLRFLFHAKAIVPFRHIPCLQRLFQRGKHAEMRALVVTSDPVTNDLYALSEWQQAAVSWWRNWSA